MTPEQEESYLKQVEMFGNVVSIGLIVGGVTVATIYAPQVVIVLLLCLVVVAGLLFL